MFKKNKILNQFYKRADFNRRKQQYTPSHFSTFNIQTILVHLNNPQEAFASFHIAGTKGKGTTAYLLSKYLQACGFKTGLYLSPHVIDLRDRFFINSKKIAWKTLLKTLDKINQLCLKKKLNATIFDILTATAFYFFKEKKVQIAIIETGLGGRLDSTNVLKPIACIITTIDFDHTSQLGNTLKKIATEKAGVIKEKTPVFCSLQKKEAYSVIKQTAKKKKAPLFLENQPSMTSFNEEILNPFEKQNIKIITSIIHQFSLKKDQKTITQFEKLISKYPLIGRFYLKDHVVYDGAHNLISIKKVVQFVKEQYPLKKIHLICYFLPDKDITAIVKAIPKKWKLTYYELNLEYISKQLSEKTIIKVSKNRKTKVVYHLKSLKKMISKDETLLVTGSFKLVGYLLKHHHKWCFN